MIRSDADFFIRLEDNDRYRIYITRNHKRYNLPAHGDFGSYFKQEYGSGIPIYPFFPDEETLAIADEVAATKDKKILSILLDCLVEKGYVKEIHVLPFRTNGLIMHP